MDAKTALKMAWMSAQAQTDDRFTWDRAHAELAGALIEVSFDEARKAANSIEDPYERTVCYLKLAMRTGEEMDLAQVFRLVDPHLNEKEEANVRLLLEAHAAFWMRDWERFKSTLWALQSSSLAKAVVSFVKTEGEWRDPSKIQDSLEWLGCIILKEWLWWTPRVLLEQREDSRVTYAHVIKHDLSISTRRLTEALCEVAAAGNSDFALEEATAPNALFVQMGTDAESPLFWAIAAGELLYTDFNRAFRECIEDVSERLEGIPRHIILVNTPYQALAYARLHVALSLKEHS